MEGHNHPRILGTMFLVLGVIVIVISFLMNITVENYSSESYNIGLMHHKESVFMLGALIEINGLFLLIFGIFKDWYIVNKNK